MALLFILSLLFGRRERDNDREPKENNFSHPIHRYETINPFTSVGIMSDFSYFITIFFLCVCADYLYSLAIIFIS